MSKKWFLGGCIVLPLLVVGGVVAIIAAISFGVSKQQEDRAKAVKEADAVKVDAPELCRAYDKGNELAADQRFKDKVLEVRGTVSEIAHVLGSPYVVLEGTNTLIGVHCDFSDQDKDQLAKLRKGQQVTVRGLCAGKSPIEPVLRACVIVSP